VSSTAADTTPSPPYGRLAAILAMYAVRAASGLWIGARLARVAAQAIGGSPAGDAGFFDAGGVVLLEAARLARSQTASLAFGIAAPVVIAAFAGLVPMAMLIRAAGRGDDEGPMALFDAALDAFGALAWLEVVGVLAEILVLALAIALGAILRAQLGWVGRAEDACFLIATSVGLAAWALAGVIHDLARVVAIERGRGVHASVSEALAVFGVWWRRVLFAWIWRGLLSLAVLASAGVLADAAGVRSTVAFAFGVFVHQAGVLLAVVWRASFLGAATGLVARIEQDPKASSS
jgi:hypothetical protein